MESDFQDGQGFFLFTTTSRSDLGTTKASNPNNTGDFSWSKTATI
jgi:hypothetical protein